MAAQALLAMHFTLNANDLSGMGLRNLQLVLNRTDLPSEAMGDGWEEVTNGLRAGTVNGDILDDVTDNMVDEIFWTAFMLDSNVAAAMRLNNAAISTSNPEYQFNIAVSQYQFGGQLNTMAMKNFSWKISGAVTRDVTP